MVKMEKVNIQSVLFVLCCVVNVFFLFRVKCPASLWGKNKIASHPVSFEAFNPPYLCLMLFRVCCARTLPESSFALACQDRHRPGMGQSQSLSCWKCREKNFPFHSAKCNMGHATCAECLLSYVTETLMPRETVRERRHRTARSMKFVHKKYQHQPYSRP